MTFAALLSAAFTWAVAVGAFLGATNVLRSRQAVPWGVAFTWLVATGLLALSFAVTASYFAFAGQRAEGDLRTLATILIAVSSALFVAVVLRFALPRPWVETIERWVIR